MGRLNEFARIRRALPPEAAELSVLAARSKAHWGYARDFMDGFREEMRVRREYIASWPVYLAETRSGELAGFHGLNLVSANTNMRQVGKFDDETEIDLAWLFIAPDFIRQGYGTLLWDHAVAAARGMGYEFLIVESDPNATGFYESKGVTYIGERPSPAIPGRTLPVYRFALI